MIDPGDRDQIRSVLEDLLLQRGPEVDRKAKARADADAYIRELRKRDPDTIEERPPVTYTDTVLPDTRLDFFTDTSPQSDGGGDSGGSSLTYPGTDGVYALQWSSSGAVFALVKLDEISVDDCSSGVTVTRKFLALPP